MSSAASPFASDLAPLLDLRHDGHGMPRPFYVDEALYAAEMEKIWRQGWIFAGFAFEIPKPGDFLTLALDTSPVLVIRGDDGQVRAFHNVCRHRGSQICRSDTGHARALVCPYHSWTYSRQGELVACHGMQDGIDKSQLGLRPLHAQVCAGLVYVSLASTPPAFDGLRARFEAAGAPQGFDRARIAHVADYDVEANWKLVWENNRECYHCTPRHPQYVKSNFDVYDEGNASEAVRQKIAAAIAGIETKWQVPAMASPTRRAESRPFPTPRTASGTRATAPRSPRGSPPNRWMARGSPR
jgi:Rieske 2Fe-2S family protein